MRKISLALLSLLLITMVGCQVEDNKTTNKEIKSEVEKNKKVKETILSDTTLKLEGKLMKFHISSIDGNDEKSYVDKEIVQIVEKIMLSAVREPGVVDMASPEFSMNLTYDNKDKEVMYLWIGEQGQRGSFMKANDTHTIYIVSEEMTKELHSLFKGKE